MRPVSSAPALDFGVPGARLVWNLSRAALYEEACRRHEGIIAEEGPLVCLTGRHTGRSPNDKFFVKEPSSDQHIAWSDVNRAMTPAQFDTLKKDLFGSLSGKQLYALDCYAGADPHYRLPVRVVTELAWHSLFARNLLIVSHGDGSQSASPLEPLTIIDVPSFQADPARHGTRCEVVIAVNFSERLVLIGGTSYAGEIKKSVFTALNYLLPLQGVLSMHCSANIGARNDAALFFGLSGTGKTTLSSDPERRLIGDDEHGWSDDGVFNFEGGCYAKVIGLSESAEPEIYATTRKFGTILENVPYDPITRLIDLDDESITENTRASYPLELIANAVPEKKAGHPKNIILLTCDASGVMPPIARLSTDQALYQFISGYTSKIAGTEVGLGKEPEITFSACFGGPFMVHHPYKYAELLKRKIERYGVQCWLVNTGWVGGPYGIGKRISIRHTRALLNAALTGKLNDVTYKKDPIFGFEVPEHCPDVPDDVLSPSSSWHDKKEYDRRYRDLAMRFKQNFGKFEDGTPREVLEAGPKV